nr:hypothetical protein [Vibrio cyclitrophicus]PMH47323.1 hypothetical protein BCU67_20980 [Vibrio cyclitrophicus]
MELKKLDGSFYQDNPAIIQALDFDAETQTWAEGKTRGHGIVQISINDLTFAIPVRSNIRHDASLILQVDRRNHHVKGMGLDYSKAMLIRDGKHVTEDSFVLRSKQAGKKLVGKEEHITKQFQKYVDKYIAAVKSGDGNILKSWEYIYTTLINYHEELGI